MITPMNLTHFHAEPKGRGVELTIEIDGKVVITTSAASDEVAEVIDVLGNAPSAEDDREPVVIDEG